MQEGILQQGIGKETAFFKSYWTLDIDKLKGFFDRKSFEEIRGKLPEKINKIIIIGKEPLKFQLAIVAMLSALNVSCPVEIETSGKVMPDFLLRNKVKRFIVRIDLKYKYSESLFALARGKDNIFLFHIRNGMDLGDSLNMIEEYLEKEQCIFIPMNKRARKLIEDCCIEDREFIMGIENG